MFHKGNLKNIGLFLLLCLSVASCSPSGGPYQSISFIDGRKLECRLLSVRTDTLIVDTTQPPTDDNKDIKAAAFPIRMIEKFHYDPTSASKTILLTTAAGFAAGTTAGFVVAGNQVDSSVTDVVLAGPIIVGYMLLGAATGALTGFLIKEFSSHNYNPHDPNDLEAISRIAKYPAGEPPELQKIK
jgi:hypothetical protein